MAARKVAAGSNIKLPADYTKLTATERRRVRERYVRMQGYKCYYCGTALDSQPSTAVLLLSRGIHWVLFPPGFQNHPVHLQHNHKTNLTEGAVHMLCNAVLWQYESR